MKTKITSHDMVHRLMQKNDIGFTAIRVVLYDQKFIMCYDGFGSNNCFVNNAPCLNGSDNYGFTSSIGHPMSNSVELLVYDDMRIYSGAHVLYYMPIGTASILLGMG